MTERDGKTQSGDAAGLGRKKAKQTTGGSMSSQWRQQGNNVYVTATNNMAPILRRDRLAKALVCYRKAYNMGETKQDTSSAAKNIGMASWRLADLVKEMGDPIKLVTFHFNEALGNFKKAVEDGSERAFEWTDSVRQNVHQCLQEGIDSLGNSIDPIERIQYLEEYMHNLPLDQVRAECCLQIAQLIFHKGVSSLQDGNYKEALRLMRECYRPIEEASKLSGDNKELKKEVNVLSSDVFLNTCVAESIQARTIGDELLEVLVKDQEDLNMDLCFTIIDHYKNAIVLTRETDVEMEAIALSRLGYLYHRVLIMKDKAKANYMRSIQLALSLHPRTFTDEKWFITSTHGLEVIQQDCVRREEDAKQKLREKMLKECKEEMTKINAHYNDCTEDLIQFVFAEFPPKKETPKIDPEQAKELSGTPLKKMLMQVISLYHPDAQNVERDGEKWKFLAEEITKLLTRKYECMKELD